MTARHTEDRSYKYPRKQTLLLIALCLVVAALLRLRRGALPIYMLGVGSEMDDLVRRRAAPRPCPTAAPVPLYFLEVVNRPLSPAAEAALGPSRRFGPIFLYTKALRP